MRSRCVYSNEARCFGFTRYIVWSTYKPRLFCCSVPWLTMESSSQFSHWLKHEDVEVNWIINNLLLRVCYYKWRWWSLLFILMSASVQQPFLCFTKNWQEIGLSWSRNHDQQRAKPITAALNYSCNCNNVSVFRELRHIARVTELFEL